MTAALAAVAEAALCAAVEKPGSSDDRNVPFHTVEYYRSIDLPGTLGDRNVTHSVGPAAQRWDVEYVEHLADGEAPVYANGSNWQFRATERATGETRTFRSGTEMGWFVLAHTYESLVLIGADIGSGRWGFTIYDLEGDRKVVEFWAAYPHLSPDNRYLVYRKMLGRHQTFDPTIKLVDFGQGANGLEAAADAPSWWEGAGIGDVVFPQPPPAGRPELAGAYGSVVTGSGFDHDVAWDMDNGTLYFTATDRADHLNLVVFRIAARRIACYVPISSSSLHSEYREKKWVHPTGVVLRSSRTVVVSTENVFGVRSSHEIALGEACFRQSPEFVELLYQ